MKRMATTLACLLAGLFGSNIWAETLSRPNILWISAEDMSPTLGCYGDRYADTPHIDALAKRSLQFSHAFATAPVCSPARACLINGVIATAQGAHQMRSTYPLPQAMLGFPSLLRRAGYFTSNNSKTDYNSGHAEKIIEASWDSNGDDAHWRQRKPGQPFFSVFNLMTSHQSRSMVWSYQKFQEEVQAQLPSERIHQPDAAPVPAYYPDTPLVRKTIARFYDCVSVMDQEVGEILKQLEDDGLSDSTVVFFFSDHGSGMPRHKRALLDTGMRVPLLVHLPEGVGEPRRIKLDRLISFEDFAATTLQLASLKPPNWMRGESFLDPAAAPREFVYGQRDRVDEIWDLARSVRSHRFLYIRNYMPHLGYNQQGAWIDQAEVRADFYKLAKQFRKSPGQAHFVNAYRPVEELYDCVDDPLNLNNLADNPDFRATLSKMRSALREQVLRTRDLGFIPETEMMKLSRGGPPAIWAAKNPTRIQAAFAAASKVGRGETTELLKLMKSPRAEIRYWGAVSLSAGLPNKPAVLAQLTAALNDESSCVRIEAANALIRLEKPTPALATLSELLKHADLTVVLHAARTIELLGERAQSLQQAMQALYDRHEHEEGDPAWFIRFSTSGFLSRLKTPNP